MSKWSAIQCAEVHDTRREWFDADGRFRASVKLECAWDDRFKLCADLYTSAYGAVLPTSTVGYHPRVYPHVGSIIAGPDSMPAPLMSRIGVDSVQVSTIPECYTTDSDSETITSKTTARIDVQYGRHYNIQESIEWDIQAITQTYQQFQWYTKPLVTGDLALLGELEAPVATYSTAILTRDFIGLGLPTQSRPLVPDITTLIGCVGKVNKYAYTSQQLGRTFKAGTLLMLEPEIRPSIDMQNVWNPTPALSPNLFGALGFSVKIRFLYKPGMIDPLGRTGAVDTSINTHNLFWRAAMKRAGSNKRGGWDRLLVKDPGVTTYDSFEPFDEEQLIDDHWLLHGSIPNSVT